MCGSYLDEQYLQQFSEIVLQSVKKLEYAHEKMFNDRFDGCSGIRKLFVSGKETGTMLDVIYDIENECWVKLIDYSVKEQSAFLDNSLTNDHLDTLEIVRLNQSALKIKEIKAFLDTEMQITYYVPD